MGDLASMGPGQGPAHASYLPWIRVMLRCCNRPAVGCQWPHLLLFPSAPEWVPNLRCECVCPATPLHCHNKGSCWFSVSSTPGGESASRQEGNHSRKCPGVGTSACLRALALAQSVQCAGGIPCMDWQNPSPPLVPARVLDQGWLHIGQRRWRLPIGHGRGKDVIALVGAPANGFVRGGLAVPKRGPARRFQPSGQRLGVGPAARLGGGSVTPGAPKPRHCWRSRGSTGGSAWPHATSAALCVFNFRRLMHTAALMAANSPTCSLPNDGCLVTCSLCAADARSQSSRRSSGPGRLLQDGRRLSSSST